jgi:hypothetical protein
MEISAASTAPNNGYAGVSALTPAELEAARKAIERRRSYSHETAGVAGIRIALELGIALAVLAVLCGCSVFAQAHWYAS